MEMANCTCCGLPVPDGQKVCSICYGDIDYGRDGYYRQWIEEQERQEEERGRNMREIKFRGRRIDNGEWVYGDLIQYKDKCFIYPCRYRDAYTESLQYEPYGRIRLQAIEVDPATVGQYTGLHDKNGKEIYEGDIVESWFPGMPYNYRAIQRIMFIDGCFGCGDYPLKFIDKLMIEVIGNIYENLSLLEAADQGVKNNDP